MSARCLYCRKPGATFRVNADARAHRSCAYAADDADQALTLSMLGSPPPAPEEAEVSFAPPRRQRYVADLIGRRFGRFLVVGYCELANSDATPRSAWRVRCTCCGRETVSRVQRGRLRLRTCPGCMPKTKLVAAEVTKIRALRAVGVPYSQLAERFGVSQTAIYKAATGATWRAAA